MRVTIGELSEGRQERPVRFRSGRLGGGLESAAAEGGLGVRLAVDSDPGLRFAPARGGLYFAFTSWGSGKTSTFLASG